MRSYDSAPCLPPPTFPGSKLSLFLNLPLCHRSRLQTEEGGCGTKPYNKKNRKFSHICIRKFRRDQVQSHLSFLSVCFIHFFLPFFFSPFLTFLPFLALPPPLFDPFSVSLSILLYILDLRRTLYT